MPAPRLHRRQDRRKRQPHCPSRKRRCAVGVATRYAAHAGRVRLEIRFLLRRRVADDVRRDPRLVRRQERLLVGRARNDVLGGCCRIVLRSNTLAGPPHLPPDIALATAGTFCCTYACCRAAVLVVKYWVRTVGAAVR